MSYASLLEDIEKRAADMEHMCAAPVSALWLDRRKAAVAARAAERQKQAQQRADAAVAALERKTQTFVEGQLLWLAEIKDVKPLRPG